MHHSGIVNMHRIASAENHTLRFKAAAAGVERVHLPSGVVSSTRVHEESVAVEKRTPAPLEAGATSATRALRHLPSCGRGPLPISIRVRRWRAERLPATSRRLLPRALRRIRRVQHAEVGSRERPHCARLVDRQQLQLT